MALQKVMILRALNEAGYANIDTKLENIMISEDGKVSMIDIGSIKEHGAKISDGFTPATAVPEIWNGNTQASSQADVFSDAIDRPYILFGGLAGKHIPKFPKMSKNDINGLHEVDKEYIAMFGRARGSSKDKDIEVPVSWKFMSYEKATEVDVEKEIREYRKAGFQEPIFPQDFTNAQKMRYMYYHLGFLKIQKEIGEVYPPKVIDSLAKLQALATDPDPDERLTCRDVENTLLHLMMSADQWKNGIYRIDGMDIVPWSMPDKILPKNNTEVKKVSPKNNGQKAIKGENIPNPAKVTPNRNRNLVNNKPGNVDLRNIVKNQAKNKNVGAKISDPKKAKIPPLFNKRFGNWFVDPQKRKQNAPKIFHQKQNVKGNKILNKVLNSGANKLNDTLHQNFGNQLNGTLNQKFRDEISMNQMNDTLNQSFRDQEDGQYQLNDLINDFSESEGVEQTRNINSNKRPAFDKILNETNEQNDEISHFDDLLEEFDEKSEIERKENSKDREIKNTRENRSSEVTLADSKNSTEASSIRQRYQRK